MNVDVEDEVYQMDETAVDKPRDHTFVFYVEDYYGLRMT